jgi:hypothetical protein
MELLSESVAGFEPTYTALQTAASPLGHTDMHDAIPTGLEPATSAVTGRRALQAALRDLGETAR